ncbi:MAG: transcriptional regulator [Cytophaga sp.]|uniref:transcriptional regulator n=1 Tax=Cytophaga sp. TaxID=29535 RepID=UPI003F80A550
MKNYFLEKDIKVFYMQADSFPDGVLAAHQKLHSLIPYSDKRKYFGISNPDKTGKIIYKAAAEELAEHEGEKLGLKTFVLKSGNYISIVIKDYQKQITAIRKAFDVLLSDPAIDPQGSCVEWYLNDTDVQCMVRLVK